MSLELLVERWRRLVFFVLLRRISQSIDFKLVMITALCGVLFAFAFSDELHTDDPVPREPDSRLGFPKSP